MSVAAQPLTEDDDPLSPWWLRTVVVVMLLGFAGLIMITLLSYRNAPMNMALLCSAATTSARVRRSSSSTA
jgi:nitric oxide reductase subunit B